MADQKLTELTELDPPSLDDIIYAVDDPASGKNSRKVTLQNIMELAPYWVYRDATEDWDEGDLTQDGNYYDLDLSSIVPAGAIAVLISGYYRTGTSSWRSINFRNNGAANSFAGSGITLDEYVYFHFIIPCDSNRVIEYNVNASMAAISIGVKGWVIDTVN